MFLFLQNLSFWGDLQGWTCSGEIKMRYSGLSEHKSISLALVCIEISENEGVRFNSPFYGGR